MADLSFAAEQKNVYPKWKLYTSLVVTAFLSLGLMYWALLLNQQVMQNFFPVYDAVHHVRIDVADGHLWFEEWVSGDPSPDIEEIMASWDKSIESIETVLNGGETDFGSVPPLEPGVLRTLVEQMLVELREFRDIANERYELYAQGGAGVGSALDESFDRVFRQYSETSQEAGLATKREMYERMVRAQRVKYALMGLALLVALFGLLLVGRYERGRQAFLERIALAQRDAENERRWLATTLDSMGDGLIMTDMEGAVTYMNPVASEMTGWTNDEAAGQAVMTVFPIFSEKTGEPAKNPVTRVIAERHVVGLANHTELVSRDGTRRPIMDSGAPIVDEEDNLLGVVLVFHDVSEARESEKRVEASEERLRLVMDATSDGLWDWNVETNEVFFSDTYYTMAGYEPGDFPMQLEEWEKRVHPDDQEKSQKQVEAHLAGLTDAFHTEFRFRRADGEYMWMTGRGRIVERAANGVPVRAVGVHQDISGRKERENELLHLQNLLNNVIDSMPSIMVGVDLDGNIIQWNARATEITGADRETVMGHPAVDFFSEAIVQMEMIRRAVRERAPQKREKVQWKKDGEFALTDVLVYPLVANGIDGAVIRIDDISTRVQIENMMVQAEKMASVGSLAAGVAHEINNPLGVMIQAVQNIERRLSHDLSKNEQVAREVGTSLKVIREYLEKRQIMNFLADIYHDGVRAADIVSNMLQFSRRSTSKFKAVALPELVDHTLRLAENDYDMKKRHDFRHIKVERDFEKGLPKIHVTATEIEQVLLNLLKNAAQAMGGAFEPKIEIRARKTGDNEITIELEDNGPGVPEHLRTRIFEPFFTTKEIGTGTGLGLSVSYMIITKNHSGSISVENSDKKGAKFVIKLPIRKEGE